MRFPKFVFSHILSSKRFLVFITFLSVLFLFLFFGKTAPFIYQTNDDLFLRTLVCGEVTGRPQPYLWYIGYPVGLLLSCLYRFFPSVSWYGLFLCAVIVLSMGIVLYQLLAMETKHSLKPESSIAAKSSTETKRSTEAIHSIKAMVLTQIATLLLFCLGSYSFLFLHVCELQYTVVTGIAGASALFLFYLASPGNNPKSTFKNYSGFFVMTFLSVSIRNKAFYMLLPFFVFLFAVKWFRSKKTERRSLNHVLLLFAGILLLIAGINKLAYSSADWQSFGRYTKASETLYDYMGYPDYESHKDLYSSLGISRSSYEAAAHHYNILLEPEIKEENMQALAKVVRSESVLSLQTLAAKCKEMVHVFIDRHLSYIDRPLNLLVWFFYAAFLLFGIVSHKKEAVEDLFLLLTSRMIIWTYLVYQGRLPSRVTQPVYLAELFLLLAVCGKHRLWEASRKMWFVFAIFFVFLCFRFGFPKAQAAAWESKSRLEFSRSFEDLKEYFSQHSDSFYYLDMNSFGSFTEDAFAGKSDGYANYLLMGSWLPHSPWYQIKFQTENISNPAEALFSDPHVYAVFLKTESTGFSYLQDFYQETFGDITLQVVEEVNVSNNLVFQIVKAAEEIESAP